SSKVVRNRRALPSTQNTLVPCSSGTQKSSPMSNTRSRTRNFMSQNFLSWRSRTQKGVGTPPGSGGAGGAAPTTSGPQPHPGQRYGREHPTVTETDRTIEEGNGDRTFRLPLGTGHVWARAPDS